jgi:hypothetical protein
VFTVKRTPLPNRLVSSGYLEAVLSLEAVKAAIFPPNKLIFLENGYFLNQTPRSRRGEHDEVHRKIRDRRVTDQRSS